jgi:hypothetical protein
MDWRIGEISSHSEFSIALGTAIAPMIFYLAIGFIISNYYIFIAIANTILSLI